MAHPGEGEHVTPDAEPAAPNQDDAEAIRRNRQALVDYFLLLQEWSKNAQPNDLASGSCVEITNAEKHPAEGYTQ